VTVSYTSTPKATITIADIFNYNLWFKVVYFTNQNIIMDNKLFLNRERAIPTARVPSVSRQEPELEVLFADRNSPVSGVTERLPFFILSETSK